MWVGNAAVVKPSEISKNSTSLLNELLPQYLDKVCANYFLIFPPAARLNYKRTFHYCPSLYILSRYLY